MSESSFTTAETWERNRGVPVGPLGDLQPPRRKKIKSKENVERETNHSFVFPGANKGSPGPALPS